MDGLRRAIGTRPLLAAAGALLLGGLIGALLTVRTSAPRTLTGLAQSAEGAISVRVGNDFHGIPLDVAWTDAAGSWHERGRPACLPPSADPISVTFQAGEFRAGGIGWLQAVWVDCRGYPIDG